MAITDKTRKILWGRSGNRCAICRHELIIDANKVDDETVVGDECHIVSGKSRGPRSDMALLADRLDEPDNLILLCRVHHKMVDDQHETYTVDLLRSLKVNHEKWVSSTLKVQQTSLPAIVRLTKEHNPSSILIRIKSSRDLLTIIDNTSAFAFDHDDLSSQAEVELVSGFLQEIQDYGDLVTDLEVSYRVRATFEMTARLEELEQAGFCVFGGRETRRLEDGVNYSSPFPIAILQVLRANNPRIIRLDPSMHSDAEQQSATDGTTAVSNNAVV